MLTKGSKVIVCQWHPRISTVPLLGRSLGARRTSLLALGRRLLIRIRRLLSAAGGFYFQQEPAIRHIYAQSSENEHVERQLTRITRRSVILPLIFADRPREIRNISPQKA